MVGETRYNLGMKIAVSLPNDLFEMADRVARRRGMSRSQLFAVALREYLAAHAHEGLTERINAVCEKVDTALDPALRRSQLGLLRREEW